MKNLCVPEIAKWRNQEADRLYGTLDDERSIGGAFEVRYVDRGMARWIRVIASSGFDQHGNINPEVPFDHLSVSLPTRCPTWEEMEFIKRLFFKPGEVCYQLHVGEANHVNIHDYCLHIWRPVDQDIPLPPIGAV